MSILLDKNEQAIIGVLIEKGLMTKEAVDQAQVRSKSQGVYFFDYIIDNNLVDPEDLTKSVAQVANIPYVNLKEAEINPLTLRLLPKDLAQHHMAIPLGEMNDQLVVAMLDADNLQTVDYLSKRIGRPLKVYLASKSGIADVLRQYEVHLDENILAGAFVQEESEDIRSIGAQIISQDSPISNTLSHILEYAASHNASDIHIEPFENALKIRVRIDGVLKEIMSLPKQAEAPMVSRVKILSNLKIDERRVPQDGEFTIQNGSDALDLRVSVGPVVWGEQVVIRLLNKTSGKKDLSDMGYQGQALDILLKSIRQTNGMILTSGPTGSGKSTSLYGVLREIQDESINIVTLEDPVEFKITGCNQTAVNPGVGLTFANGLRSILRQDPDVVLVGEIRDSETANLAIQAALTGHLVLSTLHTNSAAGILPRLLDMGIEPFLIASTVRTVIGQRLVRTLQENQEEYESSITETTAVKKVLGDVLPSSSATQEQIEESAKRLGYPAVPFADQDTYDLYRGVEDDDHAQGYQGRIGIYEVFSITESIQQLIIDRATSSVIQKQAQKEGMVTMQQDGYLKALAGITTLQEINRVIGVV